MKRITFDVALTMSMNPDNPSSKEMLEQKDSALRNLEHILKQMLGPWCENITIKGVIE